MLHRLPCENCRKIIEFYGREEEIECPTCKTVWTLDWGGAGPGTVLGELAEGLGDFAEDVLEELRQGLD